MAPSDNHPIRVLVEQQFLYYILTTAIMAPAYSATQMTRQGTPCLHTCAYIATVDACPISRVLEYLLRTTYGGRPRLVDHRSFAVRSLCHSSGKFTSILNEVRGQMSKTGKMKSKVRGERKDKFHLYETQFTQFHHIEKLCIVSFIKS